VRAVFGDAVAARPPPPPPGLDMVRTTGPGSRRADKAGTYVITVRVGGVGDPIDVFSGIVFFCLTHEGLNIPNDLFLRSVAVQMLRAKRLRTGLRATQHSRSPCPCGATAGETGFSTANDSAIGCDIAVAPDDIRAVGRKTSVPCAHLLRDTPPAGHGPTWGSPAGHHHRVASRR